MRFFESSRAVTGNVESIAAAWHTSNQLTTGVDVSVSYINGTSSQIHLVERSGLGFTLMPDLSNRNGKVTIRKTFTIDRSVYVDPHRLLDMSKDDSSIEIQVLKSAYDAVADQNKRKNSFTVDYSIGKDIIAQHGGSMYLIELDLVLSMVRDDLVPLHPYSEIGGLRYQIEDDENINDVDTFGMCIRVIDNNRRFGDRYINVMGAIYKLKATVSTKLRDGVYFLRSGAVQGDYDNCPPVGEHMSFEEAEQKLMLYRSADEAKALGDLFKQRERELSDSNHHLKLDQIRLQNRKLELDQESDLIKRNYDKEKQQDEHERRIKEASLAERTARLKDERERLEHDREMEAIRKKSEAEARSVERKEYVEILKVIPIIITASVAIIATLKSAK